MCDIIELLKLSTLNFCYELYEFCRSIISTAS